VPYRVGCLLFLLPFVEVALLFRVGAWIGVWPTLGLIATTALVGVAVVRGVGMRTLPAVQLELAQGRLPTRALLVAARLFVGAVLLIVPGVVTDLAGLILLLPLPHRLVEAWIRVRMAHAAARGGARMGYWGIHWAGGRSADPSRGADPTASHRYDVGSPGGHRAVRGSEEPEGESKPRPRPGEIIQD
jgi:UPF0716 protein FxsA